MVGHRDAQLLATLERPGHGSLGGDPVGTGPDAHPEDRAAPGGYRVGEVTIPTGSRVLLSFGAANRDPLAFDDPDVFRTDRNPRTHVGFGFGAHLCLGAPLARMEAHAVLRELVNRVSRLTIAGPPTWSTNSSLRGPTRLPVVLHR